tara:strand:- start:465 stop:683 length:219 start_codon:yes stop_codon:yes gene_type:complete
MKDFIFAINIKAVLIDDTEVNNVKGFVINNKRIYKLSDGTILTDTKKIKKFLFATFTVRPEILHSIMSLEYI